MTIKELNLTPAIELTVYLSVITLAKFATMTTRKKWAMSALASGSFLILGGVVLVLNLGVLYTRQTITRQYTIFHDQPLNPALLLGL
jgi:hypothetical protein